MYGVPAVALRWDPGAGVNIGRLVLPEDLPAGTYRLNVIAEDIAHNIGSQEVSIEVVP